MSVVQVRLSGGAESIPSDFNLQPVLPDTASSQLPDLEMYCWNRILRFTKHLFLWNLGKICAHVLHESRSVAVHPARMLLSTVNPLSSEPRLAHNVTWFAILRRLLFPLKVCLSFQDAQLFQRFCERKNGAQFRAWWTFDNVPSSTKHRTSSTDYGSW